MTIIAFLLVFSLLVFVHELGHFTVAKLTGIRVEEFGFGYPPRLLTIARRGDTEYTLNAIPFGGFVRMLGEEDPSHPDSFASKNMLVRAADLLAGSLMNIVLAVLLFIGIGLVGFDIPTGSVAIVGVAPGSPAAGAGLQEGDTILSIDGLIVRNTYELSRHTTDRLGEEVTLSIKRGEDTMPVRLTPRREPPANEGAMGVVIQTVDIVGGDKLRYSLGGALPWRPPRSTASWSRATSGHRASGATGCCRVTRSRPSPRTLRHQCRSRRLPTWSSQSKTIAWSPSTNEVRTLLPSPPWI